MCSWCMSRVVEYEYNNTGSIESPGHDNTQWSELQTWTSKPHLSTCVKVLFKGYLLNCEQETDDQHPTPLLLSPTLTLTLTLGSICHIRITIVSNMATIFRWKISKTGVQSNTVPYRPWHDIIWDWSPYRTCSQHRDGGLQGTCLFEILTFFSFLFSEGYKSCRHTLTLHSLDWGRLVVTWYRLVTIGRDRPLNNETIDAIDEARDREDR